MKIKLLLIGLLIMAVLSAGCVNFAVYDTYEEVTPAAIAYSGTVTDYALMDGDSGSGRFPSGTYGKVIFSNTNDVVTKTATSGGFNVIMDHYDATSNGVAGKMGARIVRDTGEQEFYEFTNIVDYDGFWHLASFHPVNEFSYYDSNGDGAISIDLIHDSSDANTIVVSKVFIQVEYTEASAPPTANTGNVEFYTDPIGASVLVDGSYKGVTAAYSYGVLTVTDLSAGSHSWTISKEGYNSKSGTVNVVAGGTKTISETLTIATAPPTEPTNSPPNAVITAVQPSQSMIVFNSDKSADSDGSIVKREWSLNGKVVSSAVQYQFITSDKDTGTYTVQLTVTDDDGATGTAQYIITLEGKTITETVAVTSTDITEAPVVVKNGEPEMPLTFTIPGFEAVFALIGLLTVVWLIKRDGE